MKKTCLQGENLIIADGAHSKNDVGQGRSLASPRHISAGVDQNLKRDQIAGQDSQVQRRLQGSAEQRHTR